MCEFTIAESKCSDWDGFKGILNYLRNDNVEWNIQRSAIKMALQAPHFSCYRNRMFLSILSKQHRTPWLIVIGNYSIPSFLTTVFSFLRLLLSLFTPFFSSNSRLDHSMVNMVLLWHRTCIISFTPFFSSTVDWSFQWWMWRNSGVALYMHYLVHSIFILCFIMA